MLSIVIIIDVDDFGAVINLPLPPSSNIVISVVDVTLSYTSISRRASDCERCHRCGTKEIYGIVLSSSLISFIHMEQ